MLVCPLFSYLTDKTNNRMGVYTAYGILLVVSVFRFDIGADYLNHSEMFADRAMRLNYGFNTLSLIDLLKPEPLIYLMIFITKDLPMSYVYVFALISLGTIYFIYKTFEYYHIHTIGLFVFIVTFAYFQAFDWARQGLAMSMFLYSTRYMEERKFHKYVLFMICAVLCHYSSVILFPFYAFGRFMPKHHLVPIIITGFLLMMLALGVIGVFSSMHDKITRFIPFYGQVYSNSIYTQNGVGTYRTPTYIASMLCFSAVVFMSNPKHSYLSVLLGIGATIYAIAGGNLNFIRMAWPLTTIQIILIPLAFKSENVIEYNKIFTRYIFMFLMMVFIFEWVYIHANFRDVVPYETIFSDEFSRQIFRIRAY